MSSWSIAVLAVAALLVVAGIAKVVDPAPLAANLRSVLPVSLLEPAWSTIGRVLGGLELAIALAMVIPRTQREGALGVVALGTAIVVWVLLARFRRAAEPCGCFGRASTHPLGWRNIVVAAIFIAVGCATVLAGPSRGYSTEWPLALLVLSGLSLVVVMALSARSGLTIIRGGLTWR